MTIPHMTWRGCLQQKYYRGFANNVGEKHQIRSHQDWREKLWLKQRVL
jgi:hypothetical protein